MILPTKHIRPDRSLVGLGGDVIGALERPITMSKLWDAIRRRRSASTMRERSSTTAGSCSRSICCTRYTP